MIEPIFIEATGVLSVKAGNLVGVFNAGKCCMAMCSVSIGRDFEGDCSPLVGRLAPEILKT